MKAEKENLKNATALLLEDMETLIRMPFQTIQEAADFAEKAVEKHSKFIEIQEVAITALEDIAGHEIYPATIALSALSAIKSLEDLCEEQGKTIRRYERAMPLVKILGLTIDELTDEIKWVHDNTNEQHILNRVVKMFPPEDR